MPLMLGPFISPLTPPPSPGAASSVTVPVEQLGVPSLRSLRSTNPARPRGPATAAGLALALLAALVVSARSPSASPPPSWQPQTPPLTTPWTHEISPDNALPDYPRPQLTRS